MGLFRSRDTDNSVKGENPMYKDGMPDRALIGGSTSTGKKNRIVVVFAASLLMVGLLVFFLVKGRLWEHGRFASSLKPTPIYVHPDPLSISGKW